MNILRLFQHPKELIDLNPAEVFDKVSVPQWVIVDVRTRAEFASGHIKGAIHAPLGTTGQQMADRDHNSQIVLICKTGHRSQAAARELLDMGFHQVHHLLGGMDRWRKNRMPVTRE